MPNNNYTIIKREIPRLAPALFLPELRTEVSRAFMSAKSRMIAEFLNHPVTIEIQAGPNASNISGTLGGYGNLFSFIGFERGDDPISPIIELLQGSRVEFTSQTVRGLDAVIYMPSSEEIFAATPMPWAEGRSWAKGIESGISGLGHYIQMRDMGRSGGGIQAGSRLSGVKFRNTQYISAFLNKYAKIFQQLS